MVLTTSGAEGVKCIEGIEFSHGLGSGWVPDALIVIQFLLALSDEAEK